MSQPSNQIEQLEIAAEASFCEGNFESAAANYQELIDFYESDFGNHPLTAAAYSNISRPLAELGRYEEAEGYARKALMLWQEYPEVDVSHLFSTMTNLAIILVGCQKLQEAQEILYELLELRKQEEGIHSVGYVQVIIELGRIALMKKEYPESRKLYSTAQQLLPLDHPLQTLIAKSVAILDREEATVNAESLNKRVMEKFSQGELFDSDSCKEILARQLELAQKLASTEIPDHQEMLQEIIDRTRAILDD
jgi:tetratricopeptide (TPR) repeat protein